MISNDHSHNSMIINDNKNTMTHSSSTPQQPQDHPQQQQQSLKCPRCDSANTKFCYYNNYSLSQPRHFCKACKRYWTRGGTLRNVPVGGGCRKNKRLKRPSSSSSAAATSSGISASLINSGGDSHIDQLTGSNPSPVGSSLFYGNNHDMSLPFSSSSRYEQPHHNLSAALGLGFPNNGDGGYQSSLLSSYSSIFGGSSSPTIASLLASKFSSGAGFQALAPFEELNIAGINGGHNDRYNNTNHSINSKQGVKLESDGQGGSSASALGWINGVGVGNNSATTCSDHHHQNNNNNNQIHQIGLSSSDPSLYWPTNPTAVGGGNWLDPMANLGSNNSVPSLI